MERNASVGVGDLTVPSLPRSAPAPREACTAYMGTIFGQEGRVDTRESKAKPQGRRTSGVHP